MANQRTLLGVGATTLFGLSILAVSLTLPSAAQSSGLRPVAPPLQPGAGSPPTLAPSTGQSWREALTQLDLKARVGAFDRAVDAARQDATLRDSFQAWAADSTQGELAWTAHLVLHLAKDPRGTDPFGSQFFRHPSLPGLGEDPFEPFLQGLMPGFGGLQNQGFQSQGQSFSMETGPDGIKVRVESTGPNGDETQEYGAESLDALETTHPELFDAGGPLGSLRVGTLAPGGVFGGGLAPVPSSGPPRTDVLGVMVREDDAGGLLVQRVLPGTIAAGVGLVPGDRITSVRGQHVERVADVKAALSGRAADEEVAVEWIDAGRQPRSATWKPAN